MTSLIQVSHLEVFHGDQRIVGPVSFALDRRESLTILGETGAGKSLLVKSVIGDLPPGFHAKGEIWLSGKALHALPAAEREQCWGKDFSILPQEPSLALDPLMKISGQVTEVHELVCQQSADQAEQSFQAQLEEIGLSGHGEKYPSQLSGGMAQRSAYLCATSAGGQVLIADEPTKGLDNDHRDRLVEMLAQHREKETLITITHDTQVAEQLGGQLIVLRDGEVLEQGQAADILSHPQHDYTRQLIEATHPQYWPDRPQPHMQQPLLSAHQLTVAAGNRTLLEDLSFTLHKGEILGISGPSGCGKSTLCQVILGLIPQQSGEIEYFESFRPGEKLKLYQDPPGAFAPQCTLGTLMNDICKQFAIRHSAVLQMMQRLNLHPDLLARTPRQVSGGELQRFAMLRVLLLKPKLLIADEPATRLDPLTAKETLALLMEVVQEIGCTMILVSHKKDLLSRLCHRVMDFSSKKPAPVSEGVNLSYA
ncbi:Glutathione import ATP-binding protein GsiA [Vibrio aerogenes CECT 7868]|uniref:Glutathione import ATP-binding protein GsiA n=1 Tax=Vibrio aerogenes CECT 7868 TaxID=1216006 RepID=A0A1M6DCD7_9VIBR|nr:ATP-binding cassette domain-containing protein [Vibrio aerogenes]SHI70906.1 Glutathione import ATP-binding protein GsiA [Vibrio aerogenes CECT 7868]